ncbi:DUF916 and DUF3324 domain-containing protein [Enterococcus sp. OL5]|uniref:DUF916 and DUF3324 domain-containing protein n=1 Tax=Enterococcus sp. OL5 TaxID=2590214 RepID=UPI00112A155B|nr:DUF916 and DUF3324 domain-containing protein [Enterococcus sp. OL5]TPR55077.1 DUF916 and DUF3324 domain-containing protein [Enterococcus sp. OL5]
MKSIIFNKKYFFLVGIFSVFMSFGLFQKMVFADNVNNFSIQPLNEDGGVNQQGYFHFVGQPGEKHSVSIKVYNSSDEEIKVKATVNPASTNQNGIPSYLSEEEVDPSLVYRMDELVVIEESEIKIPANGSSTINLTIFLPEEDWQGDILGGIRFTQEVDQENQQTVVHEVAYTVGILLNQSDGSSVENELSLKEVNAGQRNYRNYIEANLQNSAATIIHDMSIQSTIVREGSTTPSYTFDAYDLRMAPNSNFDVGIPTGEQSIEAGDYVLKMAVVADEKEYTFEQAFTITSQEARQLNQSAVNINQRLPYRLYGVLGGIGLLICLLIGWGWHRRKKANVVEKIVG